MGIQTDPLNISFHTGNNTNNIGILAPLLMRSADLDPVVPVDAMMLQLVDSKEMKGSTCYQANVILKGVKQKEASAIFVSRDVVERWSNSGASTSHYVIVPYRESFLFGHYTI